MGSFLYVVLLFFSFPLLLLFFLALFFHSTSIAVEEEFASQDIKGFYWVLLGITGFYWVLLYCIALYCLPGFLLVFIVLEVVDLLVSLPSFTGFYFLLPSLFLEISDPFNELTEFYWVLQIMIGFDGPFSRVYRVLLGFTGYSWVCMIRYRYLELSLFYRVLPSFQNENNRIDHAVVTWRSRRLVAVEGTNKWNEIKK